MHSSVLSWKANTRRLLVRTNCARRTYVRIVRHITDAASAENTAVHVWERREEEREYVAAAQH